MEVPEYISTALAYERLFRSQVIADAADAEASVDRLIAWHFCPDPAKHGLLFASLFREGELGLSKKLRIIRRLLKASYPDLVKPAAFWIKGLDRLREFRNMLAHARAQLPADPPPPEQAEGVSLWWPTASGELVLEFVPRARVDQQVRESRHLILAGVCLARVVEDRSCHARDEATESGLLRLVAACDEAIRSGE